LFEAFSTLALCVGISDWAINVYNVILNVVNWALTSNEKRSAGCIHSEFCYQIIVAPTESTVSPSPEVAAEIMPV
jgi:hypothetical protein